jgi:hypothetical protein
MVYTITARLNGVNSQDIRRSAKTLYNQIREHRSKVGSICFSTVTPNFRKTETIHSWVETAITDDDSMSRLRGSWVMHHG